MIHILSNIRRSGSLFCGLHYTFSKVMYICQGSVTCILNKWQILVYQVDQWYAVALDLKMVPYVKSKFESLNGLNVCYEGNDMTLNVEIIHF